MIQRRSDEFEHPCVFVFVFDCINGTIFLFHFSPVTVKKNREVDVSQQGQRSLKDLPEGKIVEILNSRSHKVTNLSLLFSFGVILMFFL